ncbi:hypothetical protein [Brevibacillus laterosporus]|uniref:hypothetical protein n=1 Tax=Brevibacillus laterosporus TaxID=1465 RepID=UPI000CE2B803|nr:hypothetical protein [Brevibacillus laterosporus]MED1664521.1 hypothetical protein [Brevibacillus laterosporus]MED1669991.1 hypothetical protein [Brevibacillus laterosporus]MED1717320.1 hypothetical protein [Brevibacillus laterosporus]PPA82366.1 hypothetical protein C4A76_21860 [Brevibacillus laterosporus]
MLVNRISPEFALEVIEMICDADQSKGRSVVLIEEVMELATKNNSLREQTVKELNMVPIR